MPKRDLSLWLTKMEAASRLGLSSRSIERLVEEKKVTSALRPNPGTKAVLVVDPSEIDRLASELEARRSRTDTEPHSRAGKLFLSVEEAAELAGLSVATLQKFIDDGTLDAVETDEGLRIRRRDLETL